MGFGWGHRAGANGVSGAPPGSLDPPTQPDAGPPTLGTSPVSTDWATMKRRDEAEVGVGALAGAGSWTPGFTPALK